MRNDLRELNCWLKDECPNADKGELVVDVSNLFDSVNGSGAVTLRLQELTPARLFDHNGTIAQQIKIGDGYNLITVLSLHFSPGAIHSHSPDLFCAPSDVITQIIEVAQSYADRHGATKVFSYYDKISGSLPKNELPGTLIARAYRALQDEDWETVDQCFYVLVSLSASGRKFATKEHVERALDALVTDDYYAGWLDFDRLGHVSLDDLAWLVFGEKGLVGHVIVRNKDTIGLFKYAMESYFSREKITPEFRFKRPRYQATVYPVCTAPNMLSPLHKIDFTKMHPNSLMFLKLVSEVPIRELDRYWLIPMLDRAIRILADKNNDMLVDDPIDLIESTPMMTFLKKHGLLGDYFSLLGSEIVMCLFLAAEGKDDEEVLSEIVDTYKTTKRELSARSYKHLLDRQRCEFLLIAQHWDEIVASGLPPALAVPLVVTGSTWNDFFDGVRERVIANIHDYPCVIDIATE